jgi:ABC-type transport system involved in multi-copper enzyme maturation permease subunit
VTSLRIAAADLRQRAGGYTLLGFACAALYFGTLLVPDTHATYWVLDLSGHRGLYNSAWVSGATSLLLVTMLAFFGILPARGAVERDAELGTAELVAASPVARTTFVLGKWMSNVAFLAAIAAIVFVGAVVTQLIRAEDTHIVAAQYGLDYLLVVLPVCCVVAGIAVLFECVAFLRGTFGIALYVLFVGFAGLALSQVRLAGTSLDPWGYAALLDPMAQAVAAHFHLSEVNQTLFGVKPAQASVTTFLFGGVAWDAPLVAERLAWVAIAVVIALGAGLLFDRYAREPRRRRSTPARRGLMRLGAFASSAVLAELAIMVADLRAAWWIAASVLVVASVLVPPPIDARFVLPLLLILPLQALAAAGARDRFDDTKAVAVIAARGTARLFAVRFAAGFLLQVFLWAPYLVRSNDAGRGLAMLLVLLAVSALAIAGGTVTRTSRTFEALFVIWWFLGPLNRLPALDLFAQVAGAPWASAAVFGSLAVLAVAATFTLDRGREIRA